MTVKELIDELKKCDQSYEIETVSQNGTTVFLGEEIRY